jgi:MoaA/NifB/PqqE/SkfB family radical SAM enzyme
MEEYSPFGLGTRGLSTDDYIKVLTNIAQAVPFSAISLTGGEPLANRDLAKISAAIRPYTPKLELNTNGVMLSKERWAALRPYYDRVKISMDSVDPERFAEITQLKMPNGLQKVQDAIRRVRDNGTEVAVNCVVMNSTLTGLSEVIEWAKKENVRLHLLDFYFTNERKTNWKDEFVPLESIIPTLTAKYGEPKKEDIFGCTFLTFNFESSQAPTRLKTSFSGTMRSDRCNVCPHYCQEGLYGLKLSQKGWLTSCPSNEEKDGLLIDPNWNIEETKNRASWLINDINSAKLISSSFKEMLKRNNLEM